MNKLIVTIIIVLILTSCINSFSQTHFYGNKDIDYNGLPDNNDFDPLLSRRLQKVLESIHREPDPKGVSACVMIPEHGTWIGAAGISHDRNPILPEMHLWIASNTKTFTAVLIMMLVEEGVLSLDDPISDWLTSYENIDGSIRIRQLLNHTSGLYDFLENPQYKTDIFSNPGKYWTQDYTLNYVLSPYFSPGTDWMYSTTNYILLGMILKKAHGVEKLSDIYREKIFNPLGLDDTYVGVDENHMGILAHGWSDFRGNGERDDLTSISDTSMLSSLWTGGAIISTAFDMAKWINDLYNQKLVSAASLSEMTDFVESDWGPIVKGHGLGTTLLVVDGDSLYGHGGYYYGYNSEIVYNPKRNLSIAVLMNRDSFGQWPQWTDLLVQNIYREIVDYKVTDINTDNRNKPTNYFVYQNYPNPFNPGTTISYSIPEKCYVKIKVFNALGSEIGILIDQEQLPGHYEIPYNGDGLSSGLYLYSLQAGNYSETRKMLIVK